MLDLLPTILVAACVLIFVYAMFIRKNWLETKALLADITIRYETALQQNKQSDQNHRSVKEQMEKLRQQVAKAEKQAEDVKNRGSESKLELIRLKTEHDDSLRKLQAQKDHLLEQVQVITQQLSEAVREKKHALEELNTLQREGDKRSQQVSEGLRAQLNELQEQLKQARRESQNAQRELEKFKQESGLVKPEELRRWQLKVARLEQLYASMKGLRDMAEERNQNWETALRYFAGHILGRSLPENVSIGAAVGEALERIGATLVHDENTLHIPKPTLENGAQAPS